MPQNANIFHHIGHQKNFFQKFAKLIKLAVGLKSFTKLAIKLAFFKNFENW